MQQVTAVESPVIQIDATLFASNGLGNPSMDAVSFAFMSTTAVPQVSDWHAGTWVQDTISGQWSAQIQIGPLGSGALAIGTYYVWIKIVDPTELIERPVDTLEVT